MTTAAILSALEADVPCILWGSPGVGKTAAVEALAADQAAHIETLIGSTLDPSDVGGIPIPLATGQVRLAPPSWAERLRKTLDEGRKAWLFLDELSCALPGVQAALLRVVHSRFAGECDLRGCRVLAAANPSDSAADGGWLSPAMAGRFMHLEWSVDPSAWVVGESRGWGKSLSPQQAQAASKVSAFIRANPQALVGDAKKRTGEVRGWPSPRAWSAVSRVLACGSEEGSAAVAGLVGPAAAAELFTYLGNLDLPDPEEVLAGRAELPKRGDQLHATLLAVAAAALSTSPDKANRIRQAWKVLGAVRADTALIAGRTLLDGAPLIMPPEAMKLGEKLLRVEKAAP